MQYRDHRTGYSGRNGIERIGKRSTEISLFIHMVGISFLLISPMKKQIATKEIFTVHIIDIPVPEIVSSPSLEKLPVKQQLKTEQKTSKEKPVIKEEKTIEKQQIPQKEIPVFSAEKFKESLIAKTGISQPSTPDKTSIQKMPESVNVEKIESATTEINISSLMSIPDWYLSTIHKKIKENWRTDNIIGERNAFVSFRVYRDGRIENIALEKSSGNTRFDRSVMEAVLSTRQVSPFPAEIPHNYLDIVIEFKTEG
ncbi:MAG: TonB family protein [bacterium]|nr:TonB family protein [bacterium]